MGERVELRVDFEVDDVVLSRLHALSFGGDADVVLAWGERLRRHSLTWVGAFLEEDLVAFVHVVWDGGAHGFLLDTVVHPARRRQGLGSLVVERAAEQAAAAGCSWLHVDYEPHLDDFYRRACGFRGTSAGLMELSRPAP